jgi:hypothetical protein
MILSFCALPRPFAGEGRGEGNAVRALILTFSLREKERFYG